MSCLCIQSQCPNLQYNGIDQFLLLKYQRRKHTMYQNECIKTDPSEIFDLNLSSHKLINRSVNLMSREKNLTERIMLIEKKKEYSETIRERNLNLITSCSTKKKNQKCNVTLNSNKNQSKKERENIENSYSCCQKPKSKYLNTERNLSFSERQCEQKKENQTGDKIKYHQKNNGHKKNPDLSSDLKVQLNKTCRVKYSVFDDPILDKSATKPNNQQMSYSNKKNNQSKQLFNISRFETINDFMTPTAPKHIESLNKLSLCSKTVQCQFQHKETDNEILKRQNKTFKRDLAKYRRENSHLLRQLQRSQNLLRQLEKASQELIQGVQIKHHKCPRNHRQLEEIKQQENEQQKNMSTDEIIECLSNQLRLLKQQQTVLRMQNTLQEKKHMQQMHSYRKKMQKQLNIWQHKYHQQQQSKQKYYEIRDQTLIEALQSP